MAELSLLGE